MATSVPEHCVVSDWPAPVLQRGRARPSQYPIDTALIDSARARLLFFAIYKKGEWAVAMRAIPDATDVEAARRWFARLADCVRAVDYEAAFPLFAEDLIAFGTYDNFVAGRAQVMEAQWTKVWPTIRHFRWRLDEVTAIVSPDRLTATGLAIFESDGFQHDGSTFERRGRATVAFERAAVGDDWVAVHTHMSLFRGTPDVSYGAPPAG